MAVVFTCGGCKARNPELTAPFVDNFDRGDVGPAWTNTGADYRVAEGKLNIKGAKNHPLWLRSRLPRDLVLDIDVMSKSPEGDTKIELFGDGQSFDADGNRYDPTGYIFVFGGWGNSSSVIGRLGEHDADIKAVRQDIRVEPGRTYHWTISRKGGLLDWKIDGKPFLSWTDPEPLTGAGHGFFAINNWSTDVYFDNLSIRPHP